MRAGDDIVITTPEGETQRYRLTRDIGGENGSAGGMGRVFGGRRVLAGGRLADETVAVKLVNHDTERQLTQNHGIVPADARAFLAQALEREGEILAMLARREGARGHSGAVGLVARGTTTEPDGERGYPVVVMERCAFTLRAALQPDATLPGPEAAALSRVRHRLSTAEGVASLMERWWRCCCG